MYTCTKYINLISPLLRRTAIMVNIEVSRHSWPAGVVHDLRTIDGMLQVRLASLDDTEQPMRVTTISLTLDTSQSLCR